MNPSDLSELVVHAHFVPSTSTCEEVHYAFLHWRVDFIAVVDDGRWVGTCSRVELAEKLGGRFGFSLYRQHLITSCLIEDPLIVHRDNSLRQLCTRALSRRGRAACEDVVLIGTEGEYLGLIPTEAIIDAQQRELDSGFEALALRRQAEEQQQASLRALTEQLNRSHAELEKARNATLEAGRMKSQFLAMISHEIRTPMNGVLGMNSLLLDSPLTPEQRDFAETVQRSGESLMAILNDILDFSKVEAGKLQFDEVDFDLRETVEGVLDLLAPRAGEKNLELISLIHRDAPARLRGDPGRIRQVLMNLVGNAIKFTASGEVDIEVSVSDIRDVDAELVFTVRDTGVGITEEAQRALFAPFTQGDTSSTRRFGGTGLGLAISRKLIEMMGGTIQLHSEAGKGSKFEFTLRLARPAEGFGSSGAPISNPAAHLGARRVLIADSNTKSLRSLQHTLEGWAFSVSSFTDGDSALQELRSAADHGQHYDFAIVDSQLPGVHGLDLARRAETMGLLRTTCIVLMTPTGKKADLHQRNGKGVNATLVKPVRQHSLLGALTQAVAAKPQDPLIPILRPTRAQVAPAITPDLRTTPDPIECASGPGMPRVLVAEDNIVNQKFIQILLKKMGFRCDVVANGLEALAALDQIPYDLVLMDCQMPELDGFEATRRIRSRTDRVRFIPIIALTANVMPGAADACLAAGMNEYMSKPVRLEDLLSKLRFHLATQPDAGHGTGSLERPGATFQEATTVRAVAA